MRSLALFLLFINITFFIWQLSLLPWLPWQPEQFKSAPPSSPSSNLPALQLVKETTSQEVESPANPTPAVEKAPNVDSSKANNPKEKTEVKPVPEKDKGATQETTEKLPQTEKLEAEKLKVAASVLAPIPVALKSETPAQKTEEIPNKTKEVMPKGETASTAPAKDKVVSDNKDSPPPKADPAKSLSVCRYQLGPYTQESSAKASLEWLRKQKAVEITMENRGTETVVNTRVYLPPFENRNAALLAQQRLTQQAITDHSILTTGSLTNAISLGVYQNVANAEQRVKQLKAHGYNNVKLEKQTKGDTIYWLNVKIAENQKKEVVSNFQKTFKSGPLLKETTCGLDTKAH